ncbi:MAG: IPT/TIG domain-containing protein, partial [Acidimicrobiales bacterium]
GALEMARCGVSVTIGGDPATVAYASPTTVDVITPKAGVSTLWVVVHVGAESSNAVPLRITSGY